MKAQNDAARFVDLSRRSTALIERSRDLRLASDMAVSQFLVSQFHFVVFERSYRSSAASSRPTSNKSNSGPGTTRLKQALEVVLAESGPDNLGVAILRLQELMALDPDLAADLELAAMHVLAHEISPPRNP